MLQPGLPWVSTINARIRSRTAAHLNLESKMTSRLDAGLTQYLFYQYLVVPILKHLLFLCDCDKVGVTLVISERKSKAIRGEKWFS